MGIIVDMSKVIELVERVENEFNSNEHKTLQNMYGMPESIKRIITLTKIIRLQQEALEFVAMPLTVKHGTVDGFIETLNNDYEKCKSTLEETNRIAGGE